MKINNITVSYSEKKQLEQFEPVEMSCTLEASIKEGDDVEESYEELMQEAKASVGRELERRVSEHEMTNEVER